MNENINKAIRLSERMRAITELVTPGNTVADVGCDHGFVSIYLVQTGISPHVLATDVREGPLARAREHIREYGLEEEIETRLSDGLSVLRTGEAQTLICAGMGGALMQRILTAEPEKTAAFAELILQPQSELTEFRIFLRTHGLAVRQERILQEDGKYYFLFRTVPGEARKAPTDRVQRLYDNFGGQLLEERNEVLVAYLRMRLRQTEQVGEALRQKSELIRQALHYMEKGV